MSYPTTKLKDISVIHTGKLDSNAAVEGGVYPFFTCDPQTLRIDTWAYDTKAVLLAGNNASGNYTAKYYEGKFNAYQRTYIIESSDEDQLNIRYLCYAINLQLQLLKTMSAGSTTKFLTIKMLHGLDIPFPDIETQNRIADILSAYNDLIENNQKQIKLLEEAAQRLYKEWFVDLRFPGYEDVPVVDEIPQGWNKRKVADFVPTFSGGTPSRSHSEYYSEGTNLWVKTQELNDGFIFDTEEKITDDAIRYSSAKRISKGSILMAMYGATIGKLGVAGKELTCNQACCVFDLSNIKYAATYLLCWLKDNREFFISQGKGAAQPNLSQAMIKNFDILVPSDSMLKSFSKITDTMLEKIAILQLQNTSLAETRDYLLTRLMSGELEV